MAQRVGRVIALLFYTAAVKGVSGQQHAPTALDPQERPGTHFTGGWVGPRAGLDGRKISFPPGFDPGPSSPVQLYRLSYQAHIYSCNIHNITYHLLEYVFKMIFSSQTCLISKEMKYRTTF